jgi:hypothetical protein
MKVTITLDDFEDKPTFTVEGFFLEMVLDAVARKAGLLEEGEEVRILCKESQQILD